MFSKIALLTISAIALVFGSFLTTTATSSAHERRAVGAYSLVVGWLAEPALINQPNAVDLRVSRAADSTPVTGLEQTLKVEVTAAGKTTEVTMRPRFNVPGAYDGRLLPTELGAYSFKITGTVEGQQINETFTAGEGTFGLIEEGNAFPNALTTNQELEERLVALESAGGDDEDNSGTAMAVGIGGMIVGALGLLTAGYSLMRKS